MAINTQCPDTFFLVITLFSWEVSHYLWGSLCTDSFHVALPIPVPVNCAKSRHSRCHRYLSITLSPFSPSAKIKFAGSGTKQMLPLPWPLVALSLLRVSNNNKTLNSGLWVLHEDSQVNKWNLNEQLSSLVILKTVTVLKKYLEKVIWALF